jgi:hypothetical protein
MRKLIALLWLSGCSSAAPLPPRVAQPAIRNPYLEDVHAHRQAWNAGKLTDYVFVLNDHPQVTSFDYIAVRAVVRQGKVVSASSLVYGGAPDFKYLPTMNALFDRAEQSAAFGEGGVPNRFIATYDSALGYLRSMDADGRATIADDESSFEVACFDTDLNGCKSILLTELKCSAAGGRVANSGDGQGCGEQGGWSIGLLSDTEMCCRNYSEVSYDELTAEQCQAANGNETTCAANETFVGASQKREAYCCRRFVM